MSASNRVLHAILDRMLQWLPDEPADSKRLDDIVDDEATAASGLAASVMPKSGVHAKGAAKIRAAS